MHSAPEIKMYSFTLDCPEPHELAKFYAALMKWQVVYYDEEFACIGPAGAAQGAYPGITFQKNAEFVAPVWPAEKNAQQQMAHLDFAVKDLEQAVQHAIACGAQVANEQFSTGWRVMLDPVGHPFCLCNMAALFASPEFALI